MASAFFDGDRFDDDEAVDDDAVDGQPSTAANEDERVLNELFAKDRGAAGPRKRVQRPQPRLDERRLGDPERGLAALPGLFRADQFPGKDPYAEMSELLGVMEHWAHVLYPKLNFEDFLQRLEQLGEKRLVKAYMAKLRLGMSVTGEDGEEAPGGEQATQQDENASPDRESPSPKRSQSPPPPVSTILTMEERHRIAENRLRALQRRQQRLEGESEAFASQHDHMGEQMQMSEEKTLDEDEAMRALFEDE